MDHYTLPDAATPFRSKEERDHYFGHPRYQTDEAWRQAVYAKTAITDFGDKAQYIPDRSHGVTIMRGDGTIEQGGVASRQYTDRESDLMALVIELTQEHDDLTDKIAAKETAAKTGPDRYIEDRFWADHPEVVKRAGKGFSTAADMEAAMTSTPYRLGVPEAVAHIEGRVLATDRTQWNPVPEIPSHSGTVHTGVVRTSIGL